MMVNKNYIVRLSSYRNALSRFKKLGFMKVFSDNLADAVGVSSAQVRKDFSIFGISGNKKGGYQSESLMDRLNEILGKDRVQEVIIVGAGNIGTALMKYQGFEKDGIKIVAAFDKNTDKTDYEREIPIYPLKELKGYVQNNKIEIGIVAVPDVQAQNVLDALVAAGVKGVLNFAPIYLRAEDEIVISNVNLCLELENVIYFVNAMKKAKTAEE
jgi:redox-sensing transcriptional repressor